MIALWVIISLAVAVAVTFASENQTVLLDQEQPSNIITNGYAAYEGKAPYIVLLSIKRDGQNGGAMGGGVIIANNWVLTAAHCLTTDYVVINYGSNWNQGRFTHTVRNNNFIRHHLWPNTNGNDIGLIRTPHVSFNNLVNRVRLPTFNQRNERFVNWWTVACGWGGQANGQVANWLQCVDIQIMSNEECSRTYGQLPDGILCTRSAGGKSICGGDSGGPLVTHDNPILVGISSFVSSAGCTSGAPAGFTRVTAHLDWVRQHSGVAYY